MSDFIILPEKKVKLLFGRLCRPNNNFSSFLAREAKPLYPPKSGQGKSLPAQIGLYGFGVASGVGVGVAVGVFSEGKGSR